jgi:SulP family sulfate permease
MLEQIKDMLHERKGYLILSQIPKTLPSGKDMKQYFGHIGLVREGSPVLVFSELDEAVEWVENRIIAEAQLHREEEKLLELPEIELFKGRKPETLVELESYMTKSSFKAGDIIFNAGDTGDELFLIRRGEVRILLPLDEIHSHHISTFGRGAFFGEMSFLDGKPRSARAVAFTDTELYGLSRTSFEKLSDEHKKVALSLMDGLARVLAGRLRYANTEIHALDS